MTHSESDTCVYYIFEQLNESHAKEIEDFLNANFLLDEPLNRAVKMPIHAFKPFVDELFKRTLHIPFTYVYRFSETNQIVALSMSSIWRAADSKEHSDFTFGEEDNKSIAAVGRILSNLHDSFYGLRPDLKSVLHLEIASVAKEHQRKGLATKLMNHVEQQFEAMAEFGLTGIATEVSSYANQCLMDKRGYKHINEVLLNTEIDEETGKQLINCDDGTDRVILMYKKLQLPN